MRAYISGVGTYLPDNIVTNQDIAGQIDTSDEWIRTRSGISERRIVDDPGLLPSDIGVKAALNAVHDAGLEVSDIGCIISGSMAPDQLFPAMAAHIQRKLGVPACPAFDVTAVCGFIPYAVNIASLMIEKGQARHILVIGAEIASRILDWTDRNTCVLFGDAAGALVLSATDDDRGVLATKLKTDGNLTDILFTERLQDKDFVRMNGKAVFKVAVKEMADITEAALGEAGLTVDALDFLVPHQANIRILHTTMTRLKLSKDKIIINLAKYGNTSSASIPLALREALDTNRIKRGDLLALTAVGAGMTWGCNIVRW
jgi:3-oxoacyl-[acyl-carrier-protein] synthase III